MAGTNRQGSPGGFTAPREPTISVAIRAHPKRAAWVSALLERLDAPAEVVWDRRNDPWDTGSRALLAADPQADYHLVIEDDAIICWNLVAGCRRALAHVPEGHPVGLYVGQNHEIIDGLFDRGRADGRSWLAYFGPWWGVGLMIPAADAERLVEWAEKECKTPKYDTRIALFYKRREMTCWYTIPSLVEHRSMVENPSLANPGQTLDRRAYGFIGEAASALDIDFSAGLVGSGSLPEALVTVVRPDGHYQKMTRERYERAFARRGWEIRE